MKQDPLYQLGNTPFPLSVLSTLYSDIRQISDKARRLESDGRIIRLKRGLYVRSSEDGAQINKKLIANHLYGPSYVSLHTALRHYGIIPEHVYEVQSVTIKHSRSFDTLVGHFTYKSCSLDYFPIGILQQSGDEGSYLIATPEKALCDLLLMTPGLNNNSFDGLRSFLEQDLRLDMDALKNFDTNLLERCRQHAAVKEHLVSLLINLVNDERHI